MTNTKTTKTAATAAAEEGLLDARFLEVAPARWPTWAMARYGVETPAGEVVEPLGVEEVDHR
jgi:hypothetical protein